METPGRHFAGQAATEAENHKPRKTAVRIPKDTSGIGGHPRTPRSPVVDRHEHEQTIEYYEQLLAEKDRKLSNASTSISGNADYSPGLSNTRNSPSIDQYEEQVSQLMESNRSLDRDLRKLRRNLQSTTEKYQNAVLELSNVKDRALEVGADQQLDSQRYLLVDELRQQVSSLKSSLAELEAEKLESSNQLEDLSLAYERLQSDHEQLSLEHQQLAQSANGFDNLPAVDNQPSLFHELLSSASSRELIPAAVDGNTQQICNDDFKNESVACIDMSQQQELLMALQNLPANVPENDELLSTEYLKNFYEEFIPLINRLGPHMERQESRKREYKQKCRLLLAEVQALREKLDEQSGALQSAEQLVRRLTVNLEGSELAEVSILLDELSRPRLNDKSNAEQQTDVFDAPPADNSPAMVNPADILRILSEIPSTPVNRKSSHNITVKHRKSPRSPHIKPRILVQKSQPQTSKDRHSFCTFLVRFFFILCFIVAAGLFILLQIDPDHDLGLQKRANDVLWSSPFWTGLDLIDIYDAKASNYAAFPL